MERRYRRLLLAYPRWYRKRRGLEILTTLLDAAAPGQRRPHWHDRRDLIIGGLRCRLRPPGGIAITLAAVAVAFALGALGAAASAWLGWQLAAGELPSDDQARAITHTVLPGQPVESIQRRDVLFGYDPPLAGLDRWLVPLLGGDDYDPGWVDVVALTSGDPTTSLSQIRDRIHAAGWQVTEIRQMGWGPRINARNDNFAAYLEITVPPDGQEVATVLSIQRAEPGPVLPLTLVGAVAGALIGWLMTCRTARNFRGRSPGTRAMLTVVTTISLLLLFPATAWTILGLIGSYLANPEPFLPFAAWGAYMFILVRGLTLLGLLGLLCVVGGSALPKPRHAAGYQRLQAR